MPNLKLCLGYVSGFSSVAGAQLYMGGVSGQEKEYKFRWFVMACFVLGSKRGWPALVGSSGGLL